MSVAFEHNRSTWEIRVAAHELLRVVFLMQAINRPPKSGNVVWLTKVTPTTRAWIVTERFVTTWITSDASPYDPEFALPIPDSFIDSLVDVVGVDDGVDIFYNEADGTIVGRAGNRYVAVDHPSGATFTQYNMPYRALPHGTQNDATVAIVNSTDIRLFSEAANNWSGRHVVGEVSPFASIDISNGQFAWTIDWRRSGYERITGAVPATTTGHITTQITPYVVGRLLNAHDIEDEVKIFVGAEDADFLYFAGENWGIRLHIESEMNARWFSPLHRALVNCDVDVDAVESARMPKFITFDIEGHDCYASLHEAEDGYKEFGRLTYVAARNVISTLELYDQLNALNASLTSASVILRDNEVRVICDFPLTELPELSKTVRAFVLAIERISQVHQLLPLFSGPTFASEIDEEDPF